MVFCAFLCVFIRFFTLFFHASRLPCEAQTVCIAPMLTAVLRLFGALRRRRFQPLRPSQRHFMRWEASFVRCASPNAVSRKKPSPLRPKPAPGVPTTFAFSSSTSKNSHEVSPPGHLSQIYGEFTPPVNHMPHCDSALAITPAFFL